MTGCSVFPITRSWSREHPMGSSSERLRECLENAWGENPSQGHTWCLTPGHPEPPAKGWDSPGPDPASVCPSTCFTRCGHNATTYTCLRLGCLFLPTFQWVVDVWGPRNKHSPGNFWERCAGRWSLGSAEGSSGCRGTGQLGAGSVLGRVSV